ncbi:MAG: NUDIX domain-containing protein [Candidatus Aenigmarchaeota archaeon]|nr:NUDIX domain-containing protein [Candidatus Aenigmarchaeota archaeon]
MQTQKRYPITVTGTFIIEGNKILLIKFNDTKGSWSGKWTVPGGKVEFGERILDAVKREALEETCLEVEPIRLMEVDEAIVDDERHYIFLNYLCRIVGGKLKAGTDAADAKWFTKEEIDKIETNHPSVRRSLQRLGFL